MLMNKNKRKKRKFIFGLVMGLVFVFGLSPVQQIEAETGAEKAARIGKSNYEGTLNKVTNPVKEVGGSYLEDGINWFLKEVFSFSVTLLGWAMNLLEYVTSADIFNGTLFSSKGLAGINEGWKALRDFLNMFFILMLLLVAFGTILRVPKFSDRKLIFSIIAAAVLINFSKTIALVIIDVSQLAMSFFISMIDSKNIDFSTAFLGEVKLQKTFAGDVKGDKYFVEILFAIVFVLVMAFMIGIIAVTLFFRLIAFYVLIILSPLAMFGLALPGTALSGMSKDWFTKMTKWAFFGPIMLFFLWLAYVVINAIANGKISGNWEGYTSGSGGAFLILVPYLAAIYLLFYGYDMAMKSSIGMANKVFAWGSKKGAEWGKKLAKGSVAVGTLGLAPYATSHLKAGYTAGKEQLERTSGLRLLTEKGKKDSQEERNDKYRARIGGESARNKARRVQANKVEKKWKDEMGGPPDRNELKRLLRKGTAGERIAAARELSKNNNLTMDKNADGEVTRNYYREAMEAVGNDQGLATEIRRNAEKESRASIIDYNTNIVMNPDGREEDRDRIINDLIEDRNRQINIENAIRPADDQLVLVNADDQPERKAFIGQYLNNQQNTRQALFNSNTNAMTSEKIASQGLDYHTAPEFVNYMNSPDGQRRFNPNEKERIFSRQLSADKQLSWINSNIVR
jgi:hypothetical protein